MAQVVIVTGSAGLVGAEAARFYLGRGRHVAGIDNDMRAAFFGAEASTAWQRRRLEADFEEYEHADADIRDREAMNRLFARYGADIDLVIHAAAQPSHDWAASDPETDFTVNANGTLVLLDSVRRYCPGAVFIHVSTNKVYGDTPNRLPLIEQETRWELDRAHPYAAHGIDESMSIDQTTHSLFGASKAAGDLLAQEYGRYFGIKTGIFRGGCLTGPGHSGTRLHGFLSYLMKCAVSGREYTIYGYKGKQVRDNIHSADLIAAFDAFYRRPRPGEVYNIGGSRFSHCSMQEAIALCEEITGRAMKTCYRDEPRIGDHIWWVSSVRKFRAHYPDWRPTYDVPMILREIYDACA
ncbi:MAG: NAD-dependent epimerase/dehydratase family protein [Lentisphaerae bacterium]|nr:NAD-dependent epimerase/dehydratase family protein [Lentisphaerota bacterium]